MFLSQISHCIGVKLGGDPIAGERFLDKDNLSPTLGEVNGGLVQIKTVRFSIVFVDIP
jgi:hypothetical protein